MNEEMQRINITTFDNNSKCNRPSNKKFFTKRITPNKSIKFDVISNDIIIL